ncbi:MAG: hypothetical protein AAGB48_04425 [Planctomycetota bacterium]
MLIASTAVFLTGLAGLTWTLFATAFGASAPLWMAAGYEAVISVSAFFGVLVGLGRFRGQEPITLGCAAVGIALSAVIESVSNKHELNGLSLMPFLLGRVGIGGLLGLAVLAGCFQAVWQWQRFIGGLLVLSPIAVLAGPTVLRPAGIRLPNPAGAITSFLDQIGPAGALFAVLAGGLLGVILLSAGGHLVLTAFESDKRTKPADEQAE